MPRISIILSTHDKAHYISDFVEHLRRIEPDAQLVLVDDGSTDGTGDILKAKGDVFLRTENVWEVKANNAALRAATGDYIAIVQDDDFILPFLWPTTIANAMAAHDLGILGCRGYGHFLYRFPAGEMKERVTGLERTITETGNMRREDNGKNFIRLTEQNGIVVGKIDVHLKNFRPQPFQPAGIAVPRVICEAVPIYATEVTIRSPLVIARQVIERIGLLDENYAPLNMDDHDYCMRARQAGFTVAFSRVPSINRFRGGSRWLYPGAPDRQRSDLMRDSLFSNSRRFYGDWLASARDTFELQMLGAIQFQPSLLTHQAVIAESQTVGRLFNTQPEQAFD
jgi:glycosyltransferase involved in cell wall biosynthesis